MTHRRDRVMQIPMPVRSSGSGGNSLGVVGAMFVLLAAVVAGGLLVLVAVMVMFPTHQYSTVPTTREMGPCEPFCSLRPTTAAPVGGEQR
ncbi:hypothetical protein ACQPZ2_44080 (plasmid) [Nocardia pseudovaccinii]|uniref:hypothetical protein n=1 Tax=Nocardia pseudovaccinii TaxID=189540 RepID=UPI003D8B483B